MSAEQAGDPKQPDEASIQPATNGDESLAEFLARFESGTHQYVITRHDPRQAMFNGQIRKTNGHCETVHSPPTEEYIRDNWGGGVYEIRIMGPQKGKGMRFVASRRIEIAGDPKLKPENMLPPSAPAAPSANNDPTLVQRMLDQSYDDKRRAEERLERERQH